MAGTKRINKEIQNVERNKAKERSYRVLRSEWGFVFYIDG